MLMDECLCSCSCISFDDSHDKTVFFLYKLGHFIKKKMLEASLTELFLHVLFVI